MNKKELFEEIYSEVLSENVGYKKSIYKSNKLIQVLIKYPEFEKVSEADNGKELLVYDEMLRYLMNTIGMFIAVHKIKNKKDKKTVIKGLKDRFEKVEKKYRNTSEEYRIEREKYVNADKELMAVINGDDKKMYTASSDAESDRFLLEIDLMFEVMLKVGKFLHEIEKIKMKSFFENKKTPEESEVFLFLKKLFIFNFSIP